MKSILVVSTLILLVSLSASAQIYKGNNTDVFDTAGGKLFVTHIVHASVMFEFEGKIIHVDPYSKGDYSDKPKADLIFLTHQHRDHLDPALIAKLKKDTTIIVGTAECAKILPGINVMANGDTESYADITVKAVPAYNVVKEGYTGRIFHPKGIGNGYIFDFGGTKVYVAGDTSNIPEMKHLGHIDIAFLPCNLPYTMTPEELAAAARAVNPKVLYAYHLGDTDVEQIKALMKEDTGIELRIAK